MNQSLRIEDYTIRNMSERMESLGTDPCLPVLELEPDLVSALQRLTEWFD